ncbi:MAG: hypothetical protein LBK77_06965 [Spirochaetaceae bacterium]|nr:hypothetical protein [Spirochaetaceae bacterium]
MIPAAFAQAPGGELSAILLDILRPQYGEESRFPRDYVIGELGRGGASEESYQAARRIMAGLVSGNAAPVLADLPGGKRAAVLDSIRALGPRAWRIGGGRNEPDGSVSFLIRFLGREQSITGELYLRYTVPAAEKSAGNGAESPRGETAAGNTADEAAAGIAAGDAAENTEAPAGDAGIADDAAGLSAAPGDPESAAENPANAAGNGGAAVANAPTVSAGPAAARWQVEDVLLEPPGSLTEGQFGPSGADMTPYERFF